MVTCQHVCTGEECYYAMDKGAINSAHVLLLPIEHFARSLACSEIAWAKMQTLSLCCKSFRCVVSLCTL